MRFTLLLMLACIVGSAQSVVNAARINPSTANFEPQPGEVAMKCDVMPLRPQLNFGFLYQAGYRVSIPLANYTGTGHFFAQLLRVTPAGGTPVYLTARVRLPVIPPTKANGEYGGSYLLGEGRYRVDWKMLDDTGRVCRKSWNVNVRKSYNERSVKVALPPGTVTDVSMRGAPRPALKDDAAPFRLTILLHAAPLSPRRTRIAVRDRTTLLGTMATMLRRLPATSVRLVVFNLDQQKELFRQDGFVLGNLDQVAQSIDDLQLGTVDVRVLQNKKGHADFTAQLLNREMAEPNASDVVVVLGPPSRFFDKVPKDDLQAAAGASPKVIYLQHMPVFQLDASLSDTIHSAVSKLRGKTVMIRTPGDFAKAIELVERRAVSDPRQ
jgi:hypothetical protein